MFADDQMNVGGDEIDVTCWQNDTIINDWMKQHGYTDLGYVVSYYYQRMMTSLKKAGFTAIFFGEAFSVLNNTGANLTRELDGHGSTCTLGLDSAATPVDGCRCKYVRALLLYYLRPLSPFVCFCACLQSGAR